jgi:hypothetical protein
MGPTTLYSPASRRGRMSELPNFEPLGFSSRSCRSTGRLLRSLAPWWGEGRSEASSFFSRGDSTRSGDFSLGFGAGPGPGATYTGASPSSNASMTKPSRTRTYNEYLLSVTKLTHCTIACKSSMHVVILDICISGYRDGWVIAVCVALIWVPGTVQVLQAHCWDCLSSQRASLADEECFFVGSL